MNEQTGRIVKVELAGVSLTASAANSIGLAARWKEARPLIMEAVKTLDQIVEKAEI